MRVDGTALGGAARTAPEAPARRPPDRDGPRAVPAGAPVPASVPAADAPRPALDASRMRAELTDLARALEGPGADRRDRARAWVIRGELRKLEALDGFRSGFIRG